MGSDSTAHKFRFTIPIPQPGETTALSGAGFDSGTTADGTLGQLITALAVTPGVGTSEFGATARADLSAGFGPPVVYAGADATVVEGQQFSGHGSFSDLDSSKWTATVTYINAADSSRVVLPLTLNPPSSSVQSADGYTAGTFDTFDLSHVFAKAGTYYVTVSVTDDSNQVGTDTSTVTVVDAPPSIDNRDIKIIVPNGGTTAEITEGETITVTGSFTDASPGDSHVATVIWGDGATTNSHDNPASVQVDETNQTFTATHRYNDNPVGQATGIYALTASISDSQQAKAATTFGLFLLQVDNVAPSNLTIGLAGTGSVNEGDLVTLTGSFSDPGVQDTHRVEIDWGDGRAHTFVNVAPGATTFSTTYQYINNPADPSTPYQIHASITDSDQPLAQTTGTSAEAFAAVKVANLPPTAVSLALVNNPTATINEGQTITLTGSFNDPGAGDAPRHHRLGRWLRAQDNELGGRRLLVHRREAHLP